MVDKELRHIGTHCFVELCLLLQVQADNAIVIINPVTVEMIHLSCKSKRGHIIITHKKESFAFLTEKFFKGPDSHVT